MDEVYSLLTTVDFPDSITDGLRATRTCCAMCWSGGDLTMGIRQDQMRQALQIRARLAHDLCVSAGPTPPAWRSAKNPTTRLISLQGR